MCQNISPCQEENYTIRHKLGQCVWQGNVSLSPSLGLIPFTPPPLSPSLSRSDSYQNGSLSYSGPLLRLHKVTVKVDFCSHRRVGAKGQPLTREEARLMFTAGLRTNQRPAARKEW